jgi:uncharacterized protein (UPF0333 family)
MDPLYIGVEGQIYLNFSGKNILVAMVVAILIATFYVLDMEYTPGVLSVYAFLEAVTLNHPATPRRKSLLKNF